MTLTLHLRGRYGSYLVYKELGGFTEDAIVPLGLYGLQLALNWAWTPIFFGAHKLKWVNLTQESAAGIAKSQRSCSFNTVFFCPIQAFVEIVFLTGTVGATMASWYSISRTATLLMAPYLSWLCLATALNYRIWRDNPEKKGE